MMIKYEDGAALYWYYMLDSIQ